VPINILIAETGKMSKAKGRHSPVHSPSQPAA